jgi:hypothetical protein
MAEPVVLLLSAVVNKHLHFTVIVVAIVGTQMCGRLTSAVSIAVGAESFLRS